MRAALRFAPAVAAGAAAATLLAGDPAGPDVAPIPAKLHAVTPPHAPADAPAPPTALAAAVRAKLAAPLPCARRFGDGELARHALHTGVHAAASAAAADAAAAAAAARVTASAAWWRARRATFLAPDDVRAAWSSYVRWAPGRDEGGRPVLVVRAGAAARAATAPTAPPGRRAPDFANAVVSSCEAFVADGDDDDAGQLVVVIDAGGAGPAATARAATTILDLARTFAAHYPGRLASLTVTSAPWAIAAPLALVERAAHPSTKRKVRLARHADDLPPGAAATLAAMERGDVEDE